MLTVFVVRGITSPSTSFLGRTEGLAKEEGWQRGSQYSDGLPARFYYGPVSNRPSFRGRTVDRVRDHRGLRCLRPYIHRFVQTIRVSPDLRPSVSPKTKSRSSRDPGERDGTTLVLLPGQGPGRNTRNAVSGLPARAYPRSRGFPASASSARELQGEFEVLRLPALTLPAR